MCSKKYLRRKVEKLMGKMISIYIFHTLLILIAVVIFIWTFNSKNIESFSWVYFIFSVSILTFLSLILWKYKLIFSYVFSLLEYGYWLVLIWTTEDDSYWLYYTFIMLPLLVFILAIPIFIEIFIRKQL